MTIKKYRRSAVCVQSGSVWCCRQRSIPHAPPSLGPHSPISCTRHESMELLGVCCAYTGRNSPPPPPRGYPLSPILDTSNHRAVLEKVAFGSARQDVIPEDPAIRPQEPALVYKNTTVAFGPPPPSDRPFVLSRMPPGVIRAYALEPKSIRARTQLYSVQGGRMWFWKMWPSACTS